MPPPIAADDVLTAEQWVPFSERASCASCAHGFTVFRQKHNCQRCGEVVCGHCLVPRRAEALDTSFEVRICIDCISVCEKHVHQSASCFVCTRRFSLLRRKYRCDECGEGVCKKCHVTKRDHSTSRAVRQARVCTNCMLRETPPKVQSSSNVVSLLDLSAPHTSGDVPLPPDEEARLHVLASYGLLDTPHEAALDVDCKLARKLMRCPMAGLSLMSRDRQWYKARCGFDETELPRAVAFGAYVVATKAPLVVLDTLDDDRFRENPIVTGPAKVRFYAGAPILAPSGHAIGTVFVLDTEPRASCNVEPLQQLAAVAMANIERHKPTDR
ncbi:hypothetical protein SDRG_08017 [Saprolegnia diclina VS20]|uniref:FYVE-type domain-containing protein n=1 Tax=Saprolegnia diclina (strain VS20) TaxID=1156394 RepID=T0QJ00_SAPDV|nr:hypothetical protein SDRG_08017 [Saprolegnia diclina VS20]EQC34701.1 hypothetical protein SDRG_08017 [Saprolegnia diclina VS20]|eukprot:XP_008612107.1 hypothetical protein SDRG_08017 [Saprolegnia diclina VS20]